MPNNFLEKGRGVGHVTTKIFGIQSNISSKPLELETSNLVHCLHLKKPSGRSNNFPQKGRGLRQVTPKIFGIRLNISSELLELGTSNLVYRFICGKPSGRANNFPPKGLGLGHVTPKFVANDHKYLYNYLGYRFQICYIDSFLESRAGVVKIFPKRGVS